MSEPRQYPDTTDIRAWWSTVHKDYPLDVHLVITGLCDSLDSLRNEMADERRRRRKPRPLTSVRIYPGPCRHAFVPNVGGGRFCISCDEGDPDDPPPADPEHGVGEDAAVPVRYIWTRSAVKKCFVLHLDSCASGNAHAKRAKDSGSVVAGTLDMAIRMVDNFDPIAIRCYIASCLTDPSRPNGCSSSSGETRTLRHNGRAPKPCPICGTLLAGRRHMDYHAKRGETA